MTSMPSPDASPLSGSPTGTSSAPRLWADVENLRDLAAVQAWAATAPQTAAGAAAIEGTSYAERMGALRHIESLATDGHALTSDMVECLLYLAATDSEQAEHAAGLLPTPWWPVAVEVLAEAGSWHGLSYYLHALPRHDTALADEVFDHLGALLNAAPTWPAPATGPRHLDDDVPEWVRAWWQRRGDLGAAAASSPARLLPLGLSDAQMHLVEAISPSKATAYVRARYSNEAAPHANTWAAVISRIDDPRLLHALFDLESPLGRDQHMGYPYRLACLAHPDLPEALANRQIVLSGAWPGAPRHQTQDVIATTCRDMAVVASNKASAGHVAALVLADPQRWWREFVAPVGLQPMGTRRTRGGPVWSPRAEEFHAALAALVAAKGTTAEEATAGADQGGADQGGANQGGPDQVWLNGQQMASRSQPLEQRLRWLLENASGPGFGAVLDAALQFPAITVRRRAASHEQLSPTAAATLIDHPDRWIRAGAAKAFENALAQA